MTNLYIEARTHLPFDCHSSQRKMIHTNIFRMPQLRRAHRFYYTNYDDSSERANKRSRTQTSSYYMGMISNIVNAITAQCCLISMHIVLFSIPFICLLAPLLLFFAWLSFVVLPTTSTPAYKQFVYGRTVYVWHLILFSSFFSFKCISLCIRTNAASSCNNNIQFLFRWYRWTSIVHT